MGRGDSLPKPGEDRALSGKSESKNEKLRLRGDDVITCRLQNIHYNKYSLSITVEQNITIKHNNKYQ